MSIAETLPQETQTDISESERFLRAIYAPGDFILIRPVETWNERGRKKSRTDFKGTRYLRIGDVLPSLLPLVEQDSERNRTNVFFGVCPRFGRDGFDQSWQIRTVRALWADLDDIKPDEAEQLVNDADLPIPSIVVSSGGGSHLYWLLDEPYLIDDASDPAKVQKEWITVEGKKRPIEFYLDGGEKIYLHDPVTGKARPQMRPPLSEKARQVQMIAKGIAATIGTKEGGRGADHTHDLSRLMRLPGTWNRKDQRNGREPVRCELVRCDEDRRYPIDEFEHLADKSDDAKREKKLAAVALPTPRKMTATRTDKLAERVARCELAEVGQRSEQDFALCCFAIEKGYLADEVWSMCESKGKFAERGRDYFDRTWAKAERSARVKALAKIEHDDTSAKKRQSPAEPEITSVVGAPPKTDDDTNTKCALEETTDLGNSRRFVHRNGADVRHCHPQKKWLVWDGHRWRYDNVGESRARAQVTARMIQTEANVAEDKQLEQWATFSQSSRAIDAILKESRSEAGIPIETDALDRDPYLLNCPNGTVDLKTGEIRPPRREDYITKLCPTNYDPQQRCDLWEETLDKIFDGSMSMVEFIYRVGGYLLTGSVKEQKFLIFWGDGSNGKSTVLDVLLQVIGFDYAQTIDSSVIMATREEQHPTGKADLFGLRLAVCMETDENRPISEATIKNLTGGDRIKARRMREDFWEFAPTHKIIICSNHKPPFRGVDSGMRRRVLLVPFTQKFWDPSKETGPDHLRQDKDLKDKLLAEREGILAWLVRGGMAWQEDGLKVPAEVVAATEHYQAEQDTIGRFLNECCTLIPQAKVQSSHLYRRYRGWSEDAGERYTFTQKIFSERIQKLGYEIKKSHGSNWVYGVGIHETQEDHHSE